MCVCCVDLVNPRRPHSGVIIIQWVTAVTLRNTPRQAFGLLPWSCAQTTICGFAMQTVKTPNSECTVSHIGGKTRHMRGHILVSRLTDHQNMLPCCTKYLLLCPKACRQQGIHTVGSMWGQSGPFSRLLRSSRAYCGPILTPGHTGGITAMS